MNHRPPMRLVSLVAILWFALAACGRKADPEAAVQEPELRVGSSSITRAETRRLEGGITMSGELVPGEVVVVMARFDGDLEAVTAREGLLVRKGSSLARYVPTEVVDHAKAAAADLLAARAALTQAENGERRARRLLDAGAAAPAELEAAVAAATAARARVDAAEAASHRAADDEEKLRVPSPIDGRVSEVRVHAGDRTAIGDPLMTLVDTRELELSATVPSEALARVTAGTAITFHIDAYPGERFTGRIDRVNPMTEPGTRQVRIYARLANADGRLVGGLFATGRVVDEVREGAVAAPVACLRTEAGEEVVYRVRRGRAERIVVRTGLRDEEAGWLEVDGQVAQGDTLLQGVLPGLQNGIRVRRIEEQG